MRGELEAFITCSDFEHGFSVAQCRRCGDCLRVPFARKSRGICPSCMGRRKAEITTLLVEHRLPEVPWRQWVLSLEGPMAIRPPGRRASHRGTPGNLRRHFRPCSMTCPTDVRSSRVRAVNRRAGPGPR
ncbi:MAG: transposase zinc-binding domain-containing protein [Nannocystaceae bacterium]|nr:transposase zinc-binding domain-containing protein [Nannocystaceae bacterium]